MAFNPFNAFRKYSKGMFAVLAIICMFTFVLSSGIGGGADFFDAVMRAGGSGRGQELATLYGEKITQQDIEDVRVQRQIANFAMIGYISRANLHIARITKAELPKLSPEIRDILSRLVTAKLQYADPLETDDPRMVRASEMRYFQELPQARFGLMSRMQGIKEDEKPEDFLAIRRIMHMVETDQFINQTSFFGFRDPFFFINAPMETDRDIVEFILWTKKAERMGIKLMPEEIKRQVARETHDLLRGSDAAMVEQRLRANFEGMNSDTLMRALTNEFQVRIAMSSLMGRNIAGGSASPGFVTPREFFEFYKDQCSETKYFTLNVPVKNFDAQVNATPTEEELRKLYEEFRGDEPEPSRATPGFKEPRKVTVEWVSGDPESAFYKTQAKLMLQLAEKLGPVFGALTVPHGGGAAANAFAIAAPFTFADAAALQEYERYTTRQLRWTDWLNPELRDTSVIRPANIAGMVAQLAGSIGTGGSVFSAPLLFERMAIENEVHTRAKVGLPIVLGHLTSNPIASVMNSAAAMPAYLPFAALKTQFRQVQNEVMARQLFLDDMRNLYGEVAKLGGKPTAKEDVAKYVADFVKPRGLQVGKTAKPLDKFHIGDDPALTPLKEVFSTGHSSMMTANDPRFGETFFDTVGASERKTYLPKWYPREPLNAPGAPKVFLTWRTEDVDPAILPFADVRDRVVVAWKHGKARELAKAAAEALAKETEALNGNRAQLLDLALQKGYKWNELGPAAKLLQEPGLADGPGNYRPYRIPTTAIEYQTPEMTDKLLSIRNEKLGAYLVMNDQPEENYYVAILVQRDEKTEANFADVYARTSTPTSRDPLFGQHMEREVMTRTRKQLVDLLKGEAKYSESKEFTERMEKAPTPQ